MFDLSDKRKNFVQRKEEEDRLIKLSSFVSLEIDNKSDFVIDFFRNCDKEGIDNLYNYFLLDKGWISWKKELERKVNLFLDILFSGDYTDRFKKILLELNYPYELMDRFNRAMVNLMYNRYDFSCFDDEGKLIETVSGNSADKINGEIKRLYSRDDEPFKFSNGINMFPVFLNEDSYDSVESLFNDFVNNSVEFDQDNFFAFSEYYAYLIEKKYLSKVKEDVRWVSRYDGDSFHYDILSYDFENNIEKIIEVKSTINRRNVFDLSSYEFNLFRYCDDAERYVYWFKLIENGVKLFILKYVPGFDDYGYFVDQDGLKYDITMMQYENVCFEVYPTDEKVTERGKILSKGLCKMFMIK